MVVFRLVENVKDYVIYRILEEGKEEGSYTIKVWKKDKSYEIEGVGKQAKNHYQAGALRGIWKYIDDNNFEKEGIEAWG